MAATLLWRCLCQSLDVRGDRGECLIRIAKIFQSQSLAHSNLYYHAFKGMSGNLTDAHANFPFLFEERFVCLFQGITVVLAVTLAAQGCVRR